MFGWFKKASVVPNGPDFSTIDSLQKAEELFRNGQLEKLFLMPLEFGGEDNPLNTVYVTIGLALSKRTLTTTSSAPWQPRVKSRNTPQQHSTKATVSFRLPSISWLQIQAILPQRLKFGAKR